VELVPHERIRYTDRFDDPNLPGEMQTTVTLKGVSTGTALNIVQEGIPAAIPPEACYLGSQEGASAAAPVSWHAATGCRRDSAGHPQWRR
jgi:uncharacterized protein YndB with AHSA1/START domain